jgi:hypothetical protein
MRLDRNLGTVILAIWLILIGLAPFVPALGALGALPQVLAIIAGILLLLGR